MSNTALTKHEEARALCERAQTGDKTALQEVLSIPNIVDAIGGDLANEARISLINRLSGKDLLFREALNRKLQMLQADLAGPSPTPLERLLVDRVVTCWLHLHNLEVRFAQKDAPTFELAEYYERRLSSAQKRYLAAIKTLAVVRKLAVPVLQVNIAKRQVNVAGSAVTTPA